MRKFLKKTFVVTACGLSFSCAAPQKEPVMAAEKQQVMDQQRVKQLIQALKDCESNVRCDAARKLGMIVDRSAVPALIEALKDEGMWVSDTAARALGAIGVNDEQFMEIMGMLSGDMRRERCGAARALGEIGNPSAVPDLLNALNDEEWEVREAVAWALGKIGDKRALPDLQEVSKNDPNDSVRNVSDEAIRAISGKQ